jgi:hypothetical protein
MNKRLNRNTKHIAEYPEKSWSGSTSAALFQRMHVDVDLHSGCDLPCYVFGKSRVLFSARKPSVMPEFPHVFVWILSAKYWQNIISYITTVSLSIIHCYVFIWKYMIQTFTHGEERYKVKSVFTVKQSPEWFNSEFEDSSLMVYDAMTTAWTKPWEPQIAQCRILPVRFFSVYNKKSYAEVEV